MDKKKALVFSVAALVTAATLSLALGLGSWAFGHRRATLHYGRLKRITEQHPARTRVEAALVAEGGRLVGYAESPTELQSLLARWTPGSEEALAAQGSRFRKARVALVGGMVYVLFFDAQDELRDFAVRPAPAGSER